MIDIVRVLKIFVLAVLVCALLGKGGVPGPDAPKIQALPELG